jgi:hypothetical protein
MVMSWIRRLVTQLSLRRSEFAPESDNVGFVEDKVALGQIFLRVLLFSTVNIIPPGLHTHIIWGFKIGPLLAAVHRHKFHSIDLSNKKLDSSEADVDREC